jgi:hypothetical protein
MASALAVDADSEATESVDETGFNLRRVLRRIGLPTDAISSRTQLASADAAGRMSTSPLMLSACRTEAASARSPGRSGHANLRKLCFPYSVKLSQATAV